MLLHVHNTASISQNIFTKTTWIYGNDEASQSQLADHTKQTQLNYWIKDYTTLPAGVANRADSIESVTKELKYVTLGHSPQRSRN